MAGSIWGEVFRVSTWGESHGEGVGVVVDGAPAGISLSEEDIQKCYGLKPEGLKRVQRNVRKIFLSVPIVEES